MGSGQVVMDQWWTDLLILLSAFEHISVAVDKQRAKKGTVTAI